MTELVLMRALQVAIGAFLLPLSQGVILDIYPKERQIVGIAWWGVGSIIGPIVGPTLGGYLTEFLSWRWVFYVNVPLGAITAMGVTLLLPESDRDDRMRFDFLGFALIGVSLAALQLTLDCGTLLDWFASKEIIIEISVAALAFYLFLVHTLTTSAPLFNPGLFKDMNFVISMSLAFLTNMLLFSMLTLVPLMMQNLLGYPVISTGLIMIPRALGSAAAMLVAVRLSLIIEPRTVVAIGVVGAAASMWQLSTFNLAVSDELLIFNGIFQGFTMGFISVPLIGVAFSTLAPEFRTDGTAVVSLVRSLSGAVGISTLQTMLARMTQVNHAEIVEGISPFNRAARNVIEQNVSHGNAAVSPLGLETEITRQATMIAYVNVYLFWTIALMLTLLLVLMTRTRKGEVIQSPSAN